jgi:hypothetical protein
MWFNPFLLLICPKPQQNRDKIEHKTEVQRLEDLSKSTWFMGNKLGFNTNLTSKLLF